MGSSVSRNLIVTSLCWMLSQLVFLKILFPPNLAVLLPVVEKMLSLSLINYRFPLSQLRIIVYQSMSFLQLVIIYPALSGLLMHLINVGLLSPLRILASILGGKIPRKVGCRKFVIS